MSMRSALILGAVLLVPQSVHSAETPYYEGKTITVVVGLSPGGGTDVFVRSFAAVMERYIPGHPQIVVQNMTGSGGLVAANHVYEKAKSDGLLLYWSNWSPISQVIGADTLPAPYDEFEFIGGVGDTRLVYCRNDIITGGLQQSADIAKASDFNVGGNHPAGSQDILMRLSLDLLGLKYNYVPGYDGGTEIYAAMLRNEIQLAFAGLTPFRTRNQELIESGQGRGLYYLVPSDAAGNFERNPNVSDIPAFPEVYRQIHGKPPSGPTFDTLNWLVKLVGDLTIVALAPPGTNEEALDALRVAYDAAAKDPEFRERTVRTFGQPYSFISWQKGDAIMDSLSDVPAGVKETLKALIESAK